jgi:L-ribulose-5-phosphate 3-epimerase
MIHSRRHFLKTLSATSLAAYSVNTIAQPSPNLKTNNVIAAANKISVFSKTLHWLDYNGMAAATKEMGFDGVDLTVRPNGHVSPENVKVDLPKAVAAVRAQGIEVYSIVTAITDTTEKYTEDILSTARDLGIGFYRLNWFNYDPIISMEENLSRMKGRIERLAKMNEKYKIHGGYQNHAGASFGASVWDLWLILKDFDPRYIGCQFDVRHATVEGAKSWVNDFKVIYPYVKSYNIKDFQWAKKEGGWMPENTPLGQGMVDFKTFFELVKKYNVSGPISIHYEYDLGGAEKGEKTVSLPREKILQPMKQDLQKLRSWLSA